MQSANYLRPPNTVFWYRYSSPCVLYHTSACKLATKAISPVVEMARHSNDMTQRSHDDTTFILNWYSTRVEI